MSVHFTCPSLLDQDPVAVENGYGIKRPCPGHLGPCRIQGTPIRPRPFRLITEETEEDYDDES